LTIEEIEDIELQLSLSESALDHYRQAYALKLKTAGSEPPTLPIGTGGKDGGQRGEKSSAKKKREGLVAADAGVCRRLNLKDKQISNIGRQHGHSHKRQLWPQTQKAIT
jgi:hypothetical protein